MTCAKPSIAVWRSSTFACCTRRAAARACGIVQSVRPLLLRPWPLTATHTQAHPSPLHPQLRPRPSPRSRLSATKTRARPRSSRRSLPSSPAAACVWARSSITGITALISMCPLRTPGAITRPDPSTWALSAPRAGRSTPTRARRTRCPRASCCRATTMSTW